MTSNLTYVSSPEASIDLRPPILVAAANRQSQERALRSLEDGGWRGAPIPIDGALDRLAMQATAGCLWIELDADDNGDALDRLLDHANDEAAAGRMPTIVAAPAAMIDPVSARLHAEHTQLLVDPDSPQRNAALVLLRAAFMGPAMLHDIAHEPASRRLRQLSDEVGRIAATLARLSTGPEAPVRSVERPVSVSGEVSAVSGELVRGLIRSRRVRARYFDEELFADPA